MAKPIADHELHVVFPDWPHLYVPNGISGEVYIGGRGIASGYYNDIESTRSSFINTRNNGILFKTGDIIRQTKKENINYEFIGRVVNSSQVKVHGMRIELLEIENVVYRGNWTWIKDVCALVSNSATISIYVIVLFSNELKEDENRNKQLQCHLQDYLPRHMLPRHIHLLPAWPRTLSGKRDDRALRALSTEDTKHTPKETTLTQVSVVQGILEHVWCQVLDLSCVSSTDSFFALGGNSLLALVILSSLKTFGISLKLSDFFSSPTLHEMVNVCSLPYSPQMELVYLSSSSSKGANIYFLPGMDGTPWHLISLASYLNAVCFGLQTPHPFPSSSVMN